MTLGVPISHTESSGSATAINSLFPSSSRSTSPVSNKRKNIEMDPDSSSESRFVHLGKDGVVRPSSKPERGTADITDGSSRKKNSGGIHPLFDKTEEKNVAMTRGGSDQVKKRRKLDIDLDVDLDLDVDERKESSKSDGSRRKSSSSSQRKRLKSLVKPPQPTPESEQTKHLVDDLKNSKDEVERLKAELAAMKEKEDGTRMVLDRFEEELCCGICQESFIDPVTVQPCGHSYCGACMANYLKSYKINDKLIWTLPGDRTNILEINHAQRKRAGETGLSTAVHKVNIPAPVPNVKYNAWGEAVYDSQDSDSEGDEDEEVGRPGTEGAHDDDGGDSEGEVYSDEGSDMDGHADSDGESHEDSMGDDAAQPPVADVVQGDVGVAIVNADGAAPAVAQPANPLDNANPQIEPTAATAETVAALDLGEPQPLAEAVVANEENNGAVQLPAPQPPADVAEVPTGVSTAPPVAPNVAQAALLPDAQPEAPAAAAVPVAVPVPVAAPAPAPAAPAVPLEVKLGEGKLSSKGLSCVFCKRTPITGIVPALALGAATELLVKARPEFAREQEAIDDHHKTYEKGQALSFPIPISAAASYTAVQKAPVRVYRDPHGGGANERYWQLCKHCPKPGRTPGTFVCPIPVPNPDRRSTRLSRDMPCPGHILCGHCDVLVPESLAKSCDGCGESTCHRCPLPLLKQLVDPPTHAEYLLYPGDIRDTVHYSRFTQELLQYFRHNATEAAIFFAWTQKMYRLAQAGRAPSDSYLNRPKKFAPSQVFAELSTWLASTEGAAAGGLKGLFERFGIQGGLQRPTGGTGRFCHSCGGNIFKAGLAEWWIRRYKKSAIQAVIPAAIKDRVKCKWGNTCFYQANETHAEQYSHLSARLTDAEVAALPEQPMPTGTGTENNHAAFRKAHAAARLLFELDIPPAPVPAVAVAVATNADAAVEAAPAAVDNTADDQPPNHEQGPAEVGVNAATAIPVVVEQDLVLPEIDEPEAMDDVVMHDPEAASHAAVENSLDDPEDW